MRKVLFTHIFVLVFFHLTFSQQLQTGYNHPFSEAFVFSIQGGGTAAITDYANFRPEYYAQTSIEYFFKLNSKHAIGLRVLGALGNLSGTDNTLAPDKFKTNFTQAGGGIVYSYYSSSQFMPYIFGGVSNLWYNPKDINGTQLPYGSTANRKLNELVYNAQIGFHSFLSDHFSLNVSVGFNYGQRDLLDGLNKPGTKNDYFFTGAIGFSYALFSKNNTNKDSDGDGVPDYKDECPGTPNGIKVSPDGCPVDSDGDGIPDYLDQCANTPKGVLTDSNGCPLDSDGDGVADYLDKCPGTSVGTAVDENGCQRVKQTIKPEVKNVEPPKTVESANVNYITNKPFHTYNASNETEVKKNIWSDGDQYVIQVSSWKTEAKANYIAEKLKAKGHNAFVQQAFVNKFNRTYYRVRIGFFSSYSEAEAYQKTLR